MKLFNDLTGKKEEFVPLEKGVVKIYACGPTVYNYFHIGNARPFIMFDALRRYFEYRGNEVIFVQNFTDIDDKIIKKANEEGSSLKAVSERYIEEYFVDAKGLGIKEATHHPKATETVPEIIDMISMLIEKGYAYAVDGDVYFSSLKFEEYGKLSHQPLDDLLAGARVEMGDKKKHPLDFVLWKASKNGEPAWETPWGEGRPGWHIECSAMAKKILGDTIDIHAGGVDLTFPHHENEIAQSEAANGCCFANYWIHNGFINVDDQKMSKSLGNFFTVRDVANLYGYEVIRFFMLSAHYRSQINYSVDIIEQAKAGLARLQNCKDNLEFVSDKGADCMSDAEKESNLKFANFHEKFIEALEDDFNTADAISIIFELVREINSLANGEISPSKEYVANSSKILNEMLDLLGLCQGGKKALDSEIEELIAMRTAARAAKDYKKSDEIRDKLAEMGVVLLDTPQGVKWQYKT